MPSHTKLGSGYNWNHTISGYNASALVQVPATVTADLLKNSSTQTAAVGLLYNSLSLMVVVSAKLLNIEQHWRLTAHTVTVAASYVNTFVVSHS